MELQKIDIDKSLEVVKAKLVFYHGSKKVVCKRCGLSYEWLRLMLTKKRKVDLKVLKVCWEVVNEYEKRDKEIIEEIAELQNV